MYKFQINVFQAHKKLTRLSVGMNIEKTIQIQLIFQSFSHTFILIIKYVSYLENKVWNILVCLFYFIEILYTNSKLFCTYIFETLTIKGYYSSIINLFF